MSSARRQKEEVGDSNCKENTDHCLNINPVPRTHDRHTLHRTRVSINHPVLFTVHDRRMHTGVPGTLFVILARRGQKGKKMKSGTNRLDPEQTLFTRE